VSAATPAPVQVILPVLDEAQGLQWLLPRMPDGYAALVVDNGSRDGSAAVAAALGAEVVTESRPGFGAACYAGLLAATSQVVAFMDADASFDPVDLPLVVDPVRDGSADLVMGSRQAGRGAWPVHARWGNQLLAWRLRARLQFPVTDLGPMRAAAREELLALGIIDRRFGWPLEMLLRADRAGWRVREVPIAYHPRLGKSKVTGTVRGTLRAIHDMSAVLR